MRRFIYVLIIITALALFSLALIHPSRQFSFEIKKMPALIPALIPALTPEHNLLFAGDIMLARAVESSIYVNGGGSWLYPFDKIAQVTAEADIAFANLEGNLSDKGVNQGSIYSFRMNPRAIDGLVYAGFDVLSLANNHSLDWGRVGLIDTINRLRQVGIKTVGAGENKTKANSPAIFTLSDGTTIAYLAYTNLYPKSLEATDDSAGVSRFNLKLIISTVQQLKNTNKADVVVVSLHWGYEYEPTPRSWQKEFAQKLIDSGADLVVGHHPHVVQPVEQYKNGWIAYSLGNFIFDQSFSSETMRGLLIKATIKSGRIISIEEVPIQISPTFQPSVAK